MREAIISFVRNNTSMNQTTSRWGTNIIVNDDGIQAYE